MRSIRHAVLSAGFALCAAVPAHADIIYSSNALWSAQDRSVWASGAGASIDTGNQFLGVQWNLGKTFGGVDCVLGACFGAQIGADTSGKVGLDYALKADSGTFDARVAGQVAVSVPTVVSGDPKNIGIVTLGTGYSGLASVQTYSGAVPTTSLLNVTGPTVQGHLGVEVNAHAFAGAQVCVVACEGPAFAPPDIAASLPIASVNEGGSGTLTLLGQTVNANQNVSALGGLINASLNVPNLDGSSSATPGGYSAGVLTSTKRDNVAAVNANVAQIAADSVGLPIPLSGNLGPFGYTLLQANAGATLDLRQTLSLTPTASGALVFSSAVTPVINGIAQPLSNVIDFKPGDSVSFLPGQVATLSIVPVIDLQESVHNQTDLVVDGNVSVQALGVDIAGLHIGPLVDLTADPGDIATIPLFDKTFADDLGTYQAQPISLDFNCSVNLGHGEFPEFGLCSSTKYVDEGPAVTLPDGAFIDLYDLVSCTARFELQAPTCTNVPVFFGSPYFPGPNGPVDLAGDSPFGFSPVNLTASTTDDGNMGKLVSLGYSPTEPPFTIPQGETADQIVPEPGSGGLFAAALAGLIVLRARRRVL